MFPFRSPGAHGATPLVRLLLPLRRGEQLQAEPQRNQHGPQQLPGLRDAQQEPALQVSVPGEPGHGGPAGERLRPRHGGPSRRHEAHPQRDAGAGREVLAGGGAAVPVRLQGAVPPHHQPDHQQTAALPAAAELRLRPGGLGGERQGLPRWGRHLGGAVAAADQQGESGDGQPAVRAAAPGAIAALPEERG